MSEEVANTEVSGDLEIVSDDEDGEEEGDSDSVDPPPEYWSSLNCLQEMRLRNATKVMPQHRNELCTKCLPTSNSSLFRHPLYNYPAVLNPGVRAALLEPQPPKTYPDDGQDLYLALCEEMNIAPCGLFHKGLLKERISLSYYGINPKGYLPMALALKNNCNVESIDFTDNFISLDGCFHFGEMLAENSTLTEINFKGCRMGPAGIKRLVANLKRNFALKKLNLAGNQLMDEGVEYLSNAIYLGARITDINLSYNRLTPNTLEHLTRSLESNNVLTSLNLSWNILGTGTAKTVEVFANVLAENEKFVELDLSWNSLTSKVYKALQTILKMPNLKVLNLSNNNLGDKAVAVFCECLLQSKHLDTLDLSFNPLTVPDAKILLRCMVLRKVKLQNLLLENVCVDDQFVKVKEQILQLKFRKGAVITHGHVYTQDNVPAPDMRGLVLTRAQVVCNLSCSKPVDFAMVILKLNRQFKENSVLGNDFKTLIVESGAKEIDSDLADEIIYAFPGSKKGKGKTCNLSAMADYVKRLWPDKKLPETPETPATVNDLSVNNGKKKSDEKERKK